MITADQLICHAIGDYVIQSDWMAGNKTKQSFAAAVHAISYAVTFIALKPSVGAFVIIAATHFVIDRWRLARYVCWLKNFLAPSGSNPPWNECRATGYPDDRPQWLAVWLLIIADNVMHVLVNGIALKYF